jgi:nucleoside-diphosphate-sugar epimerase
MRILVTGLDGFTGYYLKLELESNGHTVTGLVSDLTNPDNVDEELAKVLPEAVIHLAGIAFVGHDSVNAFYEVNTIGTRNLLSSIAKHTPKIKCILLVSSANVYGNRSEGSLSESMTPNPANDYAVSKLAMEQMAHLWFNQLPITILRPFNYTGVGQEDKYLIPKIVSHFKNKRDVIELGNLEVWREFGDVRSVVNIYRKLVELSPASETINICTGKTYSLKEIVSKCEKITGHDIEIKVNPDFVRKNEISELMGDNSKLDRLILDKKLYSLDDTLNWMLL